MAPNKRFLKNKRLVSRTKSKRGRHLLVLQKNKTALIQKLKEDAPSASGSCQTLITSTPNICRQRIQHPITEIDYSSIDLLSSTSQPNDDSLVKIDNTETDSFMDHGYCTNINDEQNEDSPLNENSRENIAPESTSVSLHATENEELSKNEGTNETTTPQLTIMQCDESEVDVTDFKNGSRIIDIMFYEEQMVQMNDHKSPSNCNFSDMQLLNETRKGLSFARTFKCSMCGVMKKMYSHRSLKVMPNHKNESATTEPAEMNINEAAVAGTLLAGIGETALNRVLSALNIPTMSSATFSKFREKVATHLETVAKETMYKSAMKARDIAIARGDVDQFGFALVPVVVDGAWCQRTYRNTYNSTGGCGVIIAADTQEVLYVGVKNKYCVICAKAKNKNIEPRKHTCHQNWGESRSSASMEAAAIVEGFLLSESMYKIRYHKMIADGDSSVYKSVRDAHPYENLIVQKIECRNHLMRNFCSNITSDCLTSSERNKEKCALKNYVLQKLPKLRSGIRKSIDYWSSQGINLQSRKGLEKDLVNAPSHVFGEHAKCAEIGYFCDGKPKKDEINMVPQLKKHSIYQSVMERIDRLVTNANSLLHNVTNNAVESFNAIIASKISGKRINYTARGEPYKKELVKGNTKK